MKKYIDPQIELISMSAADVITASSFADGLFWEQGVDDQLQIGL